MAKGLNRKLADHGIVVADDVSLRRIIWLRRAMNSSRVAHAARGGAGANKREGTGNKKAQQRHGTSHDRSASHTEEHPFPWSSPPSNTQAQCKKSAARAQPETKVTFPEWHESSTRTTVRVDR